MTRDEIQARWLVERRWVDPQAVSAALAEGAIQANIDLAARLVQRGFLDPARARIAREATGTAPPQDLLAPVPPPAELRETSGEGRAFLGARVPPPPPPSYESGRLTDSFRAPAPQSGVEPQGFGRRDLLDLLGGSAPAQAIAGRRFRKYQLEEVIGRGTAGIVLRARDLKLERLVALKLVLVDARGEAARRFKREAQALSELEHPNIVRIYELGEDGRIAFMAMELIEGQDLKALVESGAIDQDRAITLLAAIAGAVAFCHHRKVLHRDIKPSNIMVEARTGRPVLLDFGLVKRERGEGVEGSRSLTQAGAVVGTPAFMAPEQLDGKGSYGPINEKTDVWGLAATLFFALTGETPFAKTPSMMTYVALLTQRPRALREVDRRQPAWLEALCERAFERHTDERIALADLRRALANRALDEDEPLSRERPGGRLTILGGAAVGLLALVLGVAAFWRPEPLAFLEIGPRELRTREQRLLVRGRLNQGGVELLVNTEATRADAEGAFAREVTLEPGRNLIEVQAVDERGALLLSDRIEVFQDRIGPRISIEGQRPGEALALEDSALRGRVIDDSGPSRLWIGGREASLDEAGRFTFDVAEPDRGRTLKLRAVDALGNERRVSLELRGAGGLEILADLQAWAAADRAAQDRAIDEVARRLGSAFEPLGAELYASGGRRYRIAGFRHKASGVALNLIPGGRGPLGNEPDELRAVMAMFDLNSRGALERNRQRGASAEDLERFRRVLATTREDLRQQISFEAPRRTITLGRPFLLARYELSLAEWRALAPRGLPDQAERPGATAAVCTWLEARAWLDQAGLRFPSESEWEHACRAGTSSRFFHGEDFDPRCNVLTPAGRSGNQPLPHPSARAGDYPNALGLFGVMGNVFEWCQDSFLPNHQEATGDERPVLRPAGERDLRVLKGGAVRSFIEYSRCASRWWQPAEARLFNYSGLRPAFSIPAAREERGQGR